MKFTIIIPTYNDAKTLPDTLNSVLNLNYSNWELLISDDGSTDNTKNIVADFIKKNPNQNIKYFYEENKDQLNAILNVINYITGDYVYILHSDDLICQNALNEAASILSKSPELDALITNYELINSENQKIGFCKPRKYRQSKSILPLTLLWLGRNLYVDVAFHKTSTFKDKVKNNYLLWNTPFWLDNNSLLNVQNAFFCSFKYRISPENYINNEIGKLNVINGELRTATNLMAYYSIPLYACQYYLFRIFNKLHLEYQPFYFNHETKNKAKILKFIIKKRYTKEEYTHNLFLNNLFLFYQNKNPRSISLPSISSEEFIYYGKDMRKFNKALLNNELSSLYLNILNEMAKGFNKIIVPNEDTYHKALIIIKFLCLYPFVTLEINPQ